MRARENPFATDRVLRIRYRPIWQTWDELMARLERLNYRAAIVGPKGAGKTTLIEDLGVRLQKLGFAPHYFRLDDTRKFIGRRPNREFFCSLNKQSFVLLDGVEQLNHLRWFRLKRLLRRAGGLLITSHLVGRLPTLVQCNTNPTLFRGIVSELLNEKHDLVNYLTSNLLEKHRGNIRDALRECYDIYSR